MVTSGDWRVSPHGPIQTVSANVRRVEAKLERGPPLVRVMTIARMSDGRLVIHSAIALEVRAMRELDELGPVAFVIVPSAMHRLDAPGFAARYPSAQVLTPPGARARVEKLVRVDGTYKEFPEDGRVRFELLDGVGGAEGVMIVDDGDDGVTLVFNDTLFNMPHQPGLTGFVLKHITGSSGGPRVNRLARLLLVRDKAALRANLERLAGLPRLRRILVAHHEPIANAPARVLLDVASTL